MTIFNTVIGGGSGDEVEAYALGDAKNAVKGDKVVLNENNIDENPIPYSYLAEVPVNDVFTANTSLTGFVKENNGVSLIVSTVEDPNNPPPAIPDAAGFGTTINYGRKESVNGVMVFSSITDEENVGVSGFSSKSGARVEVENPFKDFSSNLTSFDIVIPFYFSAASTSSQILIETGNLEDKKVSGLLLCADVNEWPYVDINPSDGSSIITLRGGSTTTFSAGKKYWMRLTYSQSSGYVLYTSTDGLAWTQAATSTRTAPPVCSADSMFFGYDLRNPTSTAYAFKGTIYFKGLYININGTEVYNGVAPDFGSVDVGYGYFRNTLSKPSDKYVSYDGGTITKKDMVGRSHTMHPVIGRSAEAGSWTSESKGYLSSTGTAVFGANHKVDTPVYLWHDYSYITTAVPEAMQPSVKMAKGYVANGTVIGNLSGVSSMSSADDLVMTGFSDNDYLLLSENFFKKASSSFEAVVCFDSSDLSVSNAGLFDSPTTQTIRLTITSAGVLSFRVYTSSSTSATYTLTGKTTLSPNTKYWAKIKYSSATGYELLLSTDGSVYNTEATGTSKTRPYSSATGALKMGDNTTEGSSLPGNIYLKECYIDINNERVWDGFTYDYGSVSLPDSWKHISGVLYEYPKGFTSSSVDMLDDNAVRGSENSLYVTRTGDTCSMVISSTSPADADSSAVIGTVGLDENGSILSYTPK